jgi:prephenate dehydrogenase
MVVVDAPAEQHDAELSFWQAATGTTLAQLAAHPEYHGGDLGGGFALLVQRLGSGDPRIHLDIHTDNLAAEVARLEALGAERVTDVDFWCVLRDPAGLVFCVVAEPAGALNDSNAHRWD